MSDAMGDPQHGSAAESPPDALDLLDEAEATTSDMCASAMQITGAQAVIAQLEAEGVDVIFGYPGAQAIKLYDALHDSTKIRHILTRHEQGAVHAADGYARSSGKVGVVLVTSGPGATNTVTGIATAYMDSVPLVVITGQVPTTAIGTDAFQESDITTITLPITKHSYLVKDISELIPALHEAFYIASSGRPGPVLIDIPSNIAAQTLRFTAITEKPSISSYRPTYKGNVRQIREAAALIGKAKRPVLYVGGGVVASDATSELAQLARMMQIPVATTLMAKGAFNPHDALALGQPGMHGRHHVNHALAHSDLLIAVGTRFSDRVTGNANAFAPDTRVIHIDIDPAEIGKNHAAHVPIVGDARGILAGIIANLHKDEAAPCTNAWLQEIAGIAAAEKDAASARGRSAASAQEAGATDTAPATDKSGVAATDTASAAGAAAIQPYDLFSALNTLLMQIERDVIVTTDVGQHQMWASQYLDIAEPRHFISSGGLGTMGFGLPAALGAQIANPGSLVVCISGDGSIQMNSQEMATCAVNSLPIKVVLLNNNSLGMVRQWQQLFCDRRYACTLLEDNPDFVKLAEAYSWKGYSITKADEISRALEWLLSQSMPALLDVRIATEELVLPMVVPGEALGRVIDWGDV